MCLQEQQVVALKAAHPGVLLLVEVGYKMRMFGEDAEVAAKVTMGSNIYHIAIRPYFCSSLVQDEVVFLTAAYLLFGTIPLLICCSV